MKLAIVSLRFQAPGGVESHVEAVATRLARLGDQVTVYTSDLYDEGRWERRTEWPPPPRGVEVRRFPVYKRLIPGLTLPLLPGLMDALTE
ncbi:MAG TPA: glycosyltransferase, partial [Thermoplasmata archaeon]|nr:glycosyltransferase [Thermoplasmata archaeon]